MDRSYWRAICKNEYALPSEPSLEVITAELLDFLAQPDSELRDEFGYGILARWILRGHYTPDQLRALTDQMVTRLQVGLGERGTDTVFVRSFAALILAVLLTKDSQVPYLPSETVAAYTEEALHWYGREADLRGYEVTTGWAHAGAHGADLLGVLAEHPQSNGGVLRTILQTIAAKVAGLHGQIFLADEDERLVSAVMAVLQRGLLTTADFQDFLGALTERSDRWQSGALDPAEQAARHNTRDFLRSLRLRLSESPSAPNSADAAAAALNRIRRWA